MLAGSAGTAALTLAYATERRLRPRVHEPLDYDDSLVPGQIVASVMHLPHVTDREEHELGLALRGDQHRYARRVRVGGRRGGRPPPRIADMMA